MLKRKPDEVIGINYLSRWHIIPKNHVFNIYLHKYNGSDGRVLHDHPFYSVSFLLKGELKEYSLNKIRLIPKYLPIFRTAKFTHRLELVKGPVFTIFITGPKVREWGFHCSDGWKYHKDFKG